MDLLILSKGSFCCCFFVPACHVFSFQDHDRLWRLYWRPVRCDVWFNHHGLCRLQEKNQIGASPKNGPCVDIYCIYIHLITFFQKYIFWLTYKYDVKVMMLLCWIMIFVVCHGNIYERASIVGWDRGCLLSWCPACNLKNGFIHKANCTEILPSQLILKLFAFTKYTPQN